MMPPMLNLFRAYEAVCILTLTAALLLLVAFDAAGVVFGGARLVLSVIVLFLIPGYLLQKRFLPDQTNLPEVVGLSFGLSLALLPLLAVLIDLIPFLMLTTPVLAIATATMIFTLLLIDKFRPLATPAAGMIPPPPINRVDRLVIMGLVIAFAVGFLAMVGALIVPAPANQFTAFYMVGEDGLAAAYPDEITPGTAQRLRFGVSNQENRAMDYRVELRIDDVLAGTHDRFTLAHGQTLEDDIDFRVDAIRPGAAVEVLLYADHQPQPYRTLRFFNPNGEANRP